MACCICSDGWNDDLHVPRVVVKTVTGPKKTCLKRELGNHKLGAIASCQYIRTLYDVVGPEAGTAPVETTSTFEDPLCLVFEWMEYDLRTVPSGRFRENSNLPRIIAKSVLSALALVKSQYKGMHTGECLASLW